MPHPKDEDVYPVETVVRIKKTGAFAVIKDHTFQHHGRGSVYLSDGQYHLAEGMIFNERQNHKVVMSNKSYDVIANYLINAK
jgi:hypothetical protein